MNFFAHGRDVLDSPYELAGTALPDWLGATDRRARLMPERVGEGALAAGVRRHWADDARFHGHAAFHEVSRDLTLRLRHAHADEPRVRASFFGHVLVEMLLDAALIAREPGQLDRYYRSLEGVRAARVAAEAAPWLRVPAPRLADTIRYFREHRFLYGYLDDDALVARLAGTARRVRLGVPSGLRPLVPAARERVAARCDELLS
ncbi:MAG: hypothetical protein OER88_02265 [Planctomycetota bacterium]|nr:hypothetical protein [Planctomycetota bacterium]